MTPDLRLAIVVNPELPLGLIVNTAGAIAIGLGATVPALAARRLTDRGDRVVDIISSQPVPILQADGAAIRALMLKALARPDMGAGERAVVPFPAFARSQHVYADYAAAFPGRDLSEEAIDGLGLAGPAKWVRSLTGALGQCSKELPLGSLPGEAIRVGGDGNPLSAGAATPNGPAP